MRGLRDGTGPTGVLDAPSTVNREFHVNGTHAYDRRGPARWIIAHVMRYRGSLAGFAAPRLLSTVLTGAIPLLVGRAFGIIGGDWADRLDRLLTPALVIVGVVLARGVFDLASGLAAVVLANRVERDGRDELYLTLLGKS